VKILIAHARYIEPGGEETVIDAQEKALVARGHKVVRYEVDNADLRPAQMATRALWSRSAAHDVGAVLDREEPDVLHVHNNFQQLSPSIYGAASSRHVPVVQHLHNARLACINMFFERDGSLCTDCVGKRVTWPGIAHSCYRGSRVESVAATAVQLGHRAVHAHHHVDAFVAVSGALATALDGVVPPDRIEVCHNGIEDNASARDDQGYALYVGRIAREKGLQVLLDAAASVPDLPVRIVGDGPERAALEDQSRRRGLNVTFFGRLDRAGVAAAFAGARVAVVPSIGFDPLPTVAIEAMAAGVAVVGSRTGGIPEIVHTAGALVAPGDPVALAAVLRDAHENPSRWAELGQAARARYESRFTLDAFGARLEAIYEFLTLNLSSA
jgi:glycosyltransferase involved in cell wall biosynthesis